MRAGTPTFLTVAGMHAVQAGILFSTAAANGCIAVWTLMFVSHYLLPNAIHETGIRLIVAGTLSLCVGCALTAVFVSRLNMMYRIALLLPQQILLVVVALGALWFVILSSYADGVLRSRWFILADQVPIMWLFVLHTVSILRLILLRGQ